MNLIDALNSINDNKNNIIKGSNSPDLAAKLYPRFPVARSLSYSMDCIFLVNELNKMGDSVDNVQHYEFLLGVIPKKRRYNKWEKPDITEDEKLVMEIFNYSLEKARDTLTVLSSDEVNTLRQIYLQENSNDSKSQRQPRRVRKSG